MHDLTGHASFYDREHRVFLGNSLELLVTRDKAHIRVGSFAPDAPKEDIIFKDAGIVYAFLMLAQVIEEQGKPPAEEAIDLTPFAMRKPGFCNLCEGRGGTYDHHENWIICPECG